MIEAHSDTSAFGLYVHFPWCIKKCPYCDFNSHPLKAGTDQVVYLDALLGDWRQQYGSFGKARIAQTNTGQIDSIFLVAVPQAYSNHSIWHACLRRYPTKALRSRLR